MIEFKIVKRDKKSSARAGLLKTDHGIVRTPIFMPVGTQATVKAIPPADLVKLGAQIILSNTYHLYLRPGTDLIRQAGGIQKFTAWYKPILTDSGGFQIFSLAQLNKITQEGLYFQSHLDGSKHFLSPEKVVELQRNIGSDIMMVLDECIPYPVDYAYAKKSTRLTVEWAKKSLQMFDHTCSHFDYTQSIFAIIQGGTFSDLRADCTQRLVDLDFPGYAIGGLSVGEPKSAMMEMTATCTELLPEKKPRYLMGVGKPLDLLEGIERGVDMFDCILPTRNGRNGSVFTWQGVVNIKNAKYANAFEPLDSSCDCYTCRTFSKAYLRHLYQAKELLVLYLLSYHNVFFYLDFIKSCRQAILNGQFLNFKNQFIKQGGYRE